METCQKSRIKAGLKTALLLSQCRGTISHCDYFSWACPRGPVLPHTQRTHSSSGCCPFSLAPPLPRPSADALSVSTPILAPRSWGRCQTLFGERPRPHFPCNPSCPVLSPSVMFPFPGPPAHKSRLSFHFLVVTLELALSAFAPLPVHNPL